MKNQFLLTWPEQQGAARPDTHIVIFDFHSNMNKTFTPEYHMHVLMHRSGIIPDQNHCCGTAN